MYNIKHNLTLMINYKFNYNNNINKIKHFLINPMIKHLMINKIHHLSLTYLIKNNKYINKINLIIILLLLVKKLILKNHKFQNITHQQETYKAKCSSKILIN